MKIIKLLGSNFPEKFKVSKILEILGFKEDLEFETKSFLVKEIMDYIFKPNEGGNSSKKIFDMYLDYRYYYYDFFKLGIDLNKDDIDWLVFDTLLEGILLQKESAMLTVLGYRSYKKPSGNIKTYENEEHQYYLSKQRQYALPSEQKDIDEGFNKMWDYLEEQTKNERS
jgi:hypothetical protein